LNQYSPLIRQDNSPYILWQADEINRELDNMGSNTSQLDSILLDTTSTQVIQGQKTFFNLYLDNPPTYDTTMDWIEADISPLSGAGYRTITSDAPEELAIDKQNPSGVTMKLAGKNPSFMPARINASCTNGTTINLDCRNLPLAAYDPSKLGQKPSSNGDYVEPFYWATSVNSTGTAQLNGTNSSENLCTYGTGNGRYEVYVAYKDSVGTSDIFLVQEGNEANISSDYKYFKKASFFSVDSTTGTVIPFTQDAGVYSLFRKDTLSNLPNYIKSSCIVKGFVSGGGYSFENNGLFIYNDDLPGSTGKPIKEDHYITNIPMVWSLGSYLNVYSPTTIYFDTIYFGNMF